MRPPNGRYPHKLFRAVVLALVTTLLLCLIVILVIGTAGSVTIGSYTAGPSLFSQVQIVGSWLLFSASTGVISMVIIDTFKSLFYLRGLFLEYAVPRLTGLSRQGLRRLLPSDSSGFSLFPARLDMPIEQFTAQLSSRLDQAINSIGLRRWSNEPDTEEVGPSREEQLLLAFVAPSEKWQSKSGGREWAAESAEAWTADIRMQVEQKLDSLQTSLTSQWRWFLRFGASMLSALLAAVSLAVAPLPSDSIVVTGMLLASFVTGGYFASLSHDLVRVLRPVRRR
jgi:hypothetical protein